jgi:hypothetical protein
MKAHSFAITSIVLGALVVGQFFAQPSVALRFEAPVANYAGFAVGSMALVFGLAWLATHARARPKRIALAGLAALAFLLLALPTSVALLEIPSVAGGEDLSSVKLAEHRLPAGVLRLYRTDCGATCAYGLALSHEYSVLPGVKVVREVWSAYRVDSGALQSKQAAVQVVSNNKALFTYQP